MDRLFDRRPGWPALGLIAALLGCTALTGCSAGPGEAAPVTVRIVAINDLHGHLLPEAWSVRQADGRQRQVQAGGIATLGSLLGELRRDDPHLLFVGAGDLIGASPPMSALWADEPTLLALRDMGLRLSAVGNHELDLSLAPGQHQLTFAQLASVQPFNNNLVLMDLTGAQLLELLDGQWHGERFNPLQVSNGFSYRWDGRRPADHRVVPDSLRLHGEPVRSNQRYRVVANAFLAEGGDGCVTFRQGSRREDSGLMDLDATLAYLQARDLQGRPAGSLHSAGRIQRLD
jgi:2',3'-cyclic-nucleotide 2'-phosphodiesterase (5'-nucleotidase family)